VQFPQYHMYLFIKSLGSSCYHFLAPSETSRLFFDAVCKMCCMSPFLPMVCACIWRCLIFFTPLFSEMATEHSTLHYSGAWRLPQLAWCMSWIGLEVKSKVSPSSAPTFRELCKWLGVVSANVASHRNKTNVTMFPRWGTEG